MITRLQKRGLNIWLTFSTWAGSSVRCSLESSSTCISTSFSDLVASLASANSFSKSNLDSRAKKLSAPISSAADDKYEPIMFYIWFDEDWLSWKCVHDGYKISPQTFTTYIVSYVDANLVFDVLLSNNIDKNTPHIFLKRLIS